MALDPGQIRLATRLGQGALALSAALTAGVFALPAPTPPPPATNAATDAQIRTAQQEVEQAIEAARAAAAKALIEPEDWSTLTAGLSQVRAPEKPKQPTVAEAADAEDEPSEQATQPGVPQPAQTNSILATWRYLGPIIVGEAKFAVLTIRGKQVLMGVGEESQAFRLMDVAPDKLLVQHAGGALYEVALASPAPGAAGALPIVAPTNAPRPPSVSEMTVGSRRSGDGGRQR